MTRRTAFDDHLDACRNAIRATHVKGARDAMLIVHVATEIEARAGLAWWAAFFAMLDQMRR